MAEGEHVLVMEDEVDDECECEVELGELEVREMVGH